MSDYRLYCFAQSGNAYRAALMLNLIGADWEPVWIDFFGSGVQRKPDYREDVNEMGTRTPWWSQRRQGQSREALAQETL
jgi:glutathione S-transferase